LEHETHASPVLLERPCKRARGDLFREVPLVAVDLRPLVEHAEMPVHPAEGRHRPGRASYTIQVAALVLAGVASPPIVWRERYRPASAFSLSASVEVPHASKRQRQADS
jgi:hypothetical protein